MWDADVGGSSLAPYEAWFWRETQRFFADQASTALTRIRPLLRGSFLLPKIEEQRSQLEGGMDPRSALATSLVLFALFFVCVYLLPSLTCEERERGILLAQALSPASPGEILIAKFLFYPAMGLVLPGPLAGAFHPVVFPRSLFLLALLPLPLGSPRAGSPCTTPAPT